MQRSFHLHTLRPSELVELDPAAPEEPRPCVTCSRPIRQDESLHAEARTCLLPPLIPVDHTPETNQITLAHMRNRSAAYGGDRSVRECPTRDPIREARWIGRQIAGEQYYLDRGGGNGRRSGCGARPTPALGSGEDLDVATGFILDPAKICCPPLCPKSISTHDPDEAPGTLIFHPDGEKWPSRAPGSSISSGSGPSSIRRAQAIPGLPGRARGLRTKQTGAKPTRKFACMPAGRVAPTCRREWAVIVLIVSSSAHHLPRTHRLSRAVKAAAAGRPATR
jgi:hypothetical protein